MNDALFSYLRQIGATTVDRIVVDKYMETMKTEVIPKIEADIRANARRIAEIRFKPIF